MINVWWAIVGKELRDGLRDKRSLLSALIFPLLGPALIALLITTVAKSETRAQALELPVVGAEYAPSLVGFLEDQGVVIQEAPGDPEAAVRDGDLDVVLVIPEGHSEAFREGRGAPLRLILDNSRNAGRSSVKRTERVLQAYAGQIAALRLLARGVNPELVRPLDIDKRDLATPQKLAANLLDMVTMFLVLAAFICSLYIAIDTTAGERERKSLEPLLINPVPRKWLVVGKWSATAIFGAGGLVLTLAVMAVAVRLIPLEELGLRLELGPGQAAWILVTTLPLALLAGSFQLTVASFAHSFKEAQTYLSLTLFLPMMPGMIMSFNPVKTEAWMMLVPMLSQQMLVGDMLRGDPISLSRSAVAAAATLAVTAVFLALTVALFRRETIVFGK